NQQLKDRLARRCLRWFCSKNCTSLRFDLNICPWPPGASSDARVSGFGFEAIRGALEAKGRGLNLNCTGVHGRADQHGGNSRLGPHWIGEDRRVSDDRTLA